MRIVNMVRKNKILLVLIIIEIIFLLFMLCDNVVREKYNCVLGADDIVSVYPETEGVSIDKNGSVTITGMGRLDEPIEAWKVKNLSVPAGTYMISVQYEAEMLGDSCYVEMESYNSHNYLSCHNMVLNPYNNHCETVFLLSEDVDDFDVSVYYDGLGSLSIKEITVEEMLIYRWGKLLKWLCYFSVADFFVFFFLGEGIVSITREKKKEMLGILLITVFASMPLFSDVLYGGHDIKFHIERITCIAEELRNGQFPVRIYHTAKNGYGYSSSLLYGEIFLYFPAILHILGIPVFKAYQMYSIIINFLTCLISYRVFNAMFKKNTAALVGAAVYTCSYYRIMCLYTRMAVGEYTAMMFFPIVLYALWGILGFDFSGEKRKYKYYLALGMAGIIQSHIISVYLIAIFMVLICVLHIKRIMTKGVLMQLIQAVGMTICLNLWFLVPFLQNFRGDYKIVNEFPERIDKNGLYWPQIFSVFTADGQGVPSSVANDIMGDMPLGLGIPLIIGLVLFVVYRVLVGKEKCKEYELAWEGVVLGSVALWMGSVLFPWYKLLSISKSIARYAYSIQSPTRLLMVASIMLSVVLVCCIILYDRKYGYSKSIILCGVILFAVVLMCGSYYTAYFERHFKREYVQPLSAEMTLDNLYLPSGAEMEDMNDANIIHDELIDIHSYQQKSRTRVLNCTNRGSTPLTVEIPVLNHSNYQAVDRYGTKMETRKSENGRMEIVLPVGFDGTIAIQYVVPSVWRVCEGISVVSGIVFYIGMRGTLKRNISK